MFKCWMRCIVCVDMNAFFASIEQFLRPELCSKPIAITNGSRGSCIITSSYEARAFGIKTGMRFSDARFLCPQLIQVASRSVVYADFSKRLMQLLYDEFSPDIEVFSVDEAFLDMTHVHHGFTDARVLAQAIYNRVFAVLSLPCSVGISGDKTTAKYAAKLHKPNGVSVIPPLISRSILEPVNVSEICGIGPNTKRYLAKFGALTCGGVGQVPVSILSKKFGVKGQRLWLMCAGKDPDMVKSYVDRPKSMGHSKILPPGINSRSHLIRYLDVMAFQLTYRMLLHNVYALTFVCSVQLSNRQRYDCELSLSSPCRKYEDLFYWLKSVSDAISLDAMVRKVSVTALNLSDVIQYDFMSTKSSQQLKHDDCLERLLLSVNQRFGRSTLIPARLLNVFSRVQSSRVISPAWKGSVPKSQIRGSFLWD